MDNMDLEKLKETDIWTLYEQGRNYCRMINMYSETDLCYRMYNGDQWNGVKLKGVEPVQLNFIKPIVRYKTGVIHSNLYAINYSSQNFENKEFRNTAEHICEMLNKKASRIWEKDSMDIKGRAITKDAGINAQGIMYVTYNTEDNEINNEIIKKNDIYLGNENDSDIQRQPYILIKQRRPLIEVVDMARLEGVSEENINNIKADNDNFEETGDSSKLEKDLMCTLITKLYKENGTVHFAKATRYVDIKKDTDSGLTLYPIAHFLWEEKEGSARGEGEVKHLISNQIEVNKTIMRRVLVAKNTAYPQKVVAIDKITNPSAVDQVGGTVKVKGANVDDVNKVFTNINPAQMSADVEKLQTELIQTTRELAGAGEIATGQVNPEDASGRAILAVQQASQQPLTEQLVAYKSFLEDLAKIWLDMITIYNPDGVKLEETIQDEVSGEEITQLVDVPQSALRELQATVKVDITPKSAFDKFAQEMSMENLLKGGYFSSQRLGELKIYVQTLDDDSTMPKQKLEEAIAFMEEEQQKIAMMNAQAQMMQERAQQFLMSDPDAQATQMVEAAQPNIDEEVPVEM
jgi:hypothetical protein